MSDQLSLEKLANLSNTELAQVARDITGRLNNQDWQNMMADLKGSGHIHTLKETAPPFLQRYLKFEIDLDDELSKQAAFAPLMSSIVLDPRRPRGDEARILALFSSQDDGAHMRMEIQPQFDLTSLAFSVKGMLTLRFNLPRLDEDERQHFLDMMRRDQGIAVLWTPDRWERDFLIFIKKEQFTRVYAFATSIEATTRLTNEVAGTLTDWLEKAWFPRSRRRQSKRGTSMLTPLQPAILEELLKPASKPAPLVASNAPSDEAMEGIIKQLVKLDVSGRGALISIGGDKVEILGRIFTAPTQQHIMAEFRAHPDLFERVREKLGQMTGEAMLEVAPTPTPVAPPPVAQESKPAPIVDPNLDTW